MPSKSFGSSTNANLSAIIESRVFAEQLAPIPPIHNNTSLFKNLVLLSHDNAERDIKIRYKEEASMELQIRIEESSIWNAHESFEKHAPCVRYRGLRIV